jgi:COP9 signalosome complex subunit 5
MSEYVWESDKIESIQKAKPWSTNAKHYKTCRISALAATKMLEHALQGVNTGQKRGGKPLEIMGLLMGKPDGDSIIVLDTYPLPVEGTETKVMADDEKVSKYMIDLSEQLERTRPERLIGWYHSHPFDVGTHSNCFLSATDVQTQNMWQRALDPKWIAIVVDPLRSIAKQVPDMMCFRVYPPEYNGNAEECPDGKKVPDESVRSSRWGKLHYRYYALKVEYFVSEIGKSMLDILSKNHSWIRVLSSSAITEPENRMQLTDRINNLSKQLESGSGSMRSSSANNNNVARVFKSDSREDPLEQASIQSMDIATEQCEGLTKQLIKDQLFNSNSNA